jgi:N-acetylglucosaminyldiphosphoundecaprenol N-acetyl-beta-D-mannosaminyltransferase
MKISIITPSYGQLDWLKLCVASVADQNQQLKQGSWKLEAGSLRGDAPAAQGVRGAESRAGEIANSSLEIFDLKGGSAGNPQQSAIRNQESPIASPLRVEHIIQDGGTPGIEDFAKEVGAEFYCDGKLVFGSRSSTLDPRLYRLAIYSEADAGMYDAINKGMEKISGDLWAWLNCDEQYLPGTLNFVAGWFRDHPAYGILCGDALLIDCNGKAIAYRRIVRPLWLHTRLDHLASASCATFFRKSDVVRLGGFDPRWRSIGDAVWMARLIKSGVRMKACGKLFSTFAFTGQNTSESPVAKSETEEWRAGKDAPPRWLTKPVVLLHRLRKMWAGAYRRRTVKCLLHSPGSPGRVPVAGDALGWGWPDATSPGTETRAMASFRVLDTELMATDYEGLSAMLLDATAPDREALALDFANTQIVTMRRHDRFFARLTQCIDLVLPDGMPLVWVMNRKGAGLADRVYGPTFTRTFLASCPPGKTHFLVGGSEECGRRFRERMKDLNPTLEFIGGYHGPCSIEGVLEDDAQVLRDIRRLKPDFIWVGLGTPKQYGWIARVKPLLDHGALLAVGFAFDVNAGMKSDAPLWMQAKGLTWLHRLASEPKRLLGRYLKWNTLFLVYAVWDEAIKSGRSCTTQALAVTNEKS